MLQAIQLPTSIADLDTGLADVNGNNLSHIDEEEVLVCVRTTASGKRSEDRMQPAIALHNCAVTTYIVSTCMIYLVQATWASRHQWRRCNVRPKFLRNQLGIWHVCNTVRHISNETLSSVAVECVHPT